MLKDEGRNKSNVRTAPPLRMHFVIYVKKWWRMSGIHFLY